jgi:acyl-ACP dehydrogenase
VGIDEYCALLDDVFDERIVEWTAEAEASERFPRKLTSIAGKFGTGSTEMPPKAASTCARRRRRK